MNKLLAALLVAGLAVSAFAQDSSTDALKPDQEVLHANPDPAPDAATQPAPAAVLPDSMQIEQELQQLPWVQFKSVIESIPKLKADVDAYGEFGWNYVKANYTRYGWKKAIDRLDAEQRKHLVELIQLATSVK